MSAVCPRQAVSWFLLSQNLHSSWRNAGQGGEKRAAQGYEQKINEQRDFASYKCSRDNETG